jgi:hypothetical protein
MNEIAAPARVDIRAAEMLAVARALVTPDSYATVSATLAGAFNVTKIGPSAMRVLESTLAKGVVKTLARLGGARRRIRPDRGSTSPARVFEVRGVPKLAFSAYTFELIRWLTNAPLGTPGAARFTEKAETLGDQLVAYLALLLVEGERLERVVAAAPGLATPLTWLGFARSLARHGDEKSVVPKLDGLVATEDARIIVESLGGDLTRRWTASATWDPHDVLEAEQAVRIGVFERGVLDHLIEAVERANRWDLATFVVEASARVLLPGVLPRDVALRAAPKVRSEGTLRARTEARQRAGALFHGLVRVGRKREELAHVHFIDEGYDVAQATLSSWELLGREGFTRAENVLSTLASLDPLEADVPAAVPQ